MPTVYEALQLLSATALGLLAGALLTEGCLLVPYWRWLSADEFYALYKQLYPRLYRYFTPITVVPLLLTLIGGISGVLRADASQWFMVCAFGFCLCATITHELYFKKANTQFANATLKPDALAIELARWAVWHWLRTGLAALALGAALLGLTR